MTVTAEWKTVSIGDLGKVVTGKTPPTSRPELFGEGYPFITPTDIQSEQHWVDTERFVSEEGRKSQRNLLLPAGSVCFVCIGPTIGKICITKVPSFTNQQINSVVVDDDRFDKRFVYYLLRTKIDAVKGIAGGSATPIVNKSAFSSVEVDVPPLETQRKIASILSAYDDLIENNTRRIKILEEMAQAIYREWFVNFRFPGHEKVRMVDSPLGRVPEGWEVGRLDDALVLQRGFDLPKKDRVEEGSVPVFAATGLNGHHSEAKVKAPCVITGRSGSLGTVIYVDEDFWPLNTTLWVKEFRRATSIFAYYLLSGLGLAQYNAGAAVPTLNRNDIHGLSVVLPPRRLLEVFESHLTTIFRFKNVLQKKAENLRQTRDLLLPKLISGEVNVGPVI